MSTDNTHARGDTGSERAGILAVVLGALALAATAFTYVLSLSEGFNPPGWVRATGLAWLPIGFFGTAFAYMAARKGTGRRSGTLGLILAGAGIVAFVVLLIIAG
ncbi:hypothetical protein DQ353_12205 [Arthrobacter sp. AQ5-05]|uniref:hypothetical protein n=1 Tax=Arthrobacter sp. AQ5-05 TaxID=2184581 RepID=UPI000DCBE974|nr:hypothetical protein [Arthrobacter sp. AQ5-05]RAX49080.1 hypothetical protein DQ353_12205 [Arthrobacter sp. AQ5-05]